MTSIKPPKLDPFTAMFLEDALRNVERALALIVRDKPKPKGRIFQVDMELVHARSMLRAALHGNKP